MARRQGVAEVADLVKAYVRQELARGLGDWEQRLGTALVRSGPSDLVRPSGRSPDAPPDDPAPPDPTPRDPA